MRKLFILIGISFSGKSRWTDSYIEKHPETIVVCPDEIRKELTGDISNQNRNYEVFERAHSETKLWLERNENVIFDATNVSAKSRRDLTIIGQQSRAQIIYVLFEPPSMDIINTRMLLDADRIKNGLRSNVPIEAIIKQRNTLINNLPLIENEDWDELIKV